MKRLFSYTMVIGLATQLFVSIVTLVLAVQIGDRLHPRSSGHDDRGNIGRSPSRRYWNSGPGPKLPVVARKPRPTVSAAEDAPEKKRLAVAMTESQRNSLHRLSMVLNPNGTVDYDEITFSEFIRSNPRFLKANEKFIGQLNAHISSMATPKKGRPSIVWKASNRPDQDRSGFDNSLPIRVIRRKFAGMTIKELHQELRNPTLVVEFPADPKFGWTQRAQAWAKSAKEMPGSGTVKYRFASFVERDRSYRSGRKWKSRGLSLHASTDGKFADGGFISLTWTKVESLRIPCGPITKIDLQLLELLGATATLVKVSGLRDLKVEEAIALLKNK